VVCGLLLKVCAVLFNKEICEPGKYCSTTRHVTTMRDFKTHELPPPRQPLILLYSIEIKIHFFNSEELICA